MARTPIHSTEAPAALGPYSQAIDADPFVYFAGQTPLDPATGELVDGDIDVQTNRVFDNLFLVLDAAGLTSDDVIKVNAFLTDMPNDFGVMNAVYKTRFEEPYPARTTIGVAALPFGARVEIEMIARRPG